MKKPPVIKVTPPELIAQDRAIRQWAEEQWREWEQELHYWAGHYFNEKINELKSEIAKRRVAEKKAIDEWVDESYLVNEQRLLKWYDDECAKKENELNKELVSTRSDFRELLDLYDRKKGTKEEFLQEWTAYKKNLRRVEIEEWVNEQKAVRKNELDGWFEKQKSSLQEQLDQWADKAEIDKEQQIREWEEHEQHRIHAKLDDEYTKKAASQRHLINKWAHDQKKRKSDELEKWAKETKEKKLIELHEWVEQNGVEKVVEKSDDKQKMKIFKKLKEWFDSRNEPKPESEPPPEPPPEPSSTPHRTLPGEKKTPPKIPPKSKNIIIGFDLGTSNTKIILHDDVQGLHFAPCAPIGSADSVLFPTVIYQKGDELSLVPKGKDWKQHTNLKLQFMKCMHDSDYRSNKSFHLLVAFIAQCIQHSVSSLQAFNSSYIRDQLELDLVLGHPSVELLFNRKNKGKLEAAFHDLAKFALTAYEQKFEFDSMESVERFCESPPSGIQNAKADTYPELLAQVSTINNVEEYSNYGKSIQIDVGAGTLDMIMFSNHDPDRNEGDNKISVYAAFVKHLGAENFHRFRLQFLEENINGYQFSGIHPWQDYTKSQGSFLKTNYYTESETNNRLDEELTRIDDSFRRTLQQAIMGLYANCLNMLNDRAQGRLGLHSEKFHFYLTGGGSNLQMYQGAKNYNYRLFNRSIEVTPFPAFDVKSSNNVTFPFHRMSVAYGLSHGVMNLSDFDLKVLYEEEEKHRRQARAIDPNLCRHVNSKGIQCKRSPVFRHDYCILHQ